MRDFHWAILGMATLGVVGCGDNHGDSDSDAELGQVTLRMAAAPSDVQCLVVKADSAARTVRRDIDVIAGNAITVSLTGLPTGNVNLGAAAYAEECAVVTSASVPIWLSDPATQPMTLATGAPTAWDLVLRPNAVVNATVDWAGDDANVPPRFVATSIATGGEGHTCALLNSGSLRCWGNNYQGQLGNGTTTMSTVPVAVAGISNAIAVAAGYRHSCALLDNGLVQCWGYNDAGDLGNGTNTNSSVRVTVSGISNAIAIAVDASCAVLSDHSLKCWGQGSMGLMASSGSSPTTLVPVTVPGISSAVGADGSCALLSTGQVQCWGANDGGQLGDGTPIGNSLAHSDVPVTVSGISNAVALASSYQHSCALLSTGSMQCWGYNQNGELGNATTTSSSVPVMVAGISNAIAIATYYGRSCAVLSTGQVQCWGANDGGQLGDGTTTDSSVPVTVAGISNAIAVATSQQHTCVLLSGGSVWCWGRQAYGILGDGNYTPSSVPLKVYGF